MMKTNNEMSATPSYTAPVAKLINARLEGLICQSLNGLVPGGDGVDVDVDPTEY